MKKLGLAVIFLLMLSLTGCIQEYQLSEESTNVAAEYMAGILLAQDENVSDLVDYDKLAERREDKVTDSGEELEEQQKPTPTLQAKEGAPIEDQKDEIVVLNQNITLSEVIGTKDFDIQYVGYQLYEVYPENGTNTYFSLTPREGNQLLVASFSMENITKKEKRIDLKKADIVYQLDINVGTIYKPLFTLLENDLRYIDMSIGAGKKVTVLLIFEVPKDIDMKDINLIVSRDSKSEIIEIK